MGTTVELDSFFVGSSKPLEVPHAFIQWKGTDVCMDFHCKCGFHSHWDVDFAYAIKCPNCARIYEMANLVVCRENPEYQGCVQEKCNELEEVLVKKFVDGQVK